MKKVVNLINSINTEVLLFFLGCFPIIKLFSTVSSGRFPYQYFGIAVPVAIIVVYEVFEKKIEYIAMNLFLSLYVGMTFYNSNGNITLANVKMFIAAFVYLNLVVIIVNFLRVNKDPFQHKYLKKYLQYTFYSALVTLSLMTISWFLLFRKFPYDWDINNVLGLLTFSRDQVAFRSYTIIRINPVGLLTGNLENLSYIGAQLLLPALVFTVSHLLGIIKKINLKFNFLAMCVFYVQFFLYLLVINSRAMCLFVFLCVVFKYLNFAKLMLLRLVVLILCFFPFSIYLLSSKTLSERHCQFNFVKNNLSIFGNGIGYGVQQLNQLCSYTFGTYKFEFSILTYAYDNVHIEFIHYFGFLLYLLLVIIFIRKIKPVIYSIYFALFIFIFLSLNFNLFEVYLAPLTSFLLYFSVFDNVENNLDVKQG